MNVEQSNVVRRSKKNSWDVYSSHCYGPERLNSSVSTQVQEYSMCLACSKRQKIVCGFSYLFGFLNRYQWKQS